MGKIYTDEFLISELQRFNRENGRVPGALDMQYKFGYPSYHDYERCFGKWNNALIVAGLKVNQTKEKRTGNETCYICGHSRKKSQQWHTKGLLDGQVMCPKCYHDPDYMNKNLDPKSSLGKAFVDQIIVAKVLGLELENDCNCSIGFNAPYDLYDKDGYEYINVKSSILVSSKEQESYWSFHLSQKETPDTYIMLGYDEKRKNILKVWITDAIDDLVFNEKTEKLLKGKSISNLYKSLKKAEPWEVDVKPYNDVLYSMSLDNCSVLRSD